MLTDILDHDPYFGVESLHAGPAKQRSLGEDASEQATVFNERIKRNSFILGMSGRPLCQLVTVTANRKGSTLVNTGLVLSPSRVSGKQESIRLIEPFSTMLVVDDT